MQMSENSTKSFSFGLRELTEEENRTYCGSNSSSLEKPPILNSSPRFTSDYSYKVFTSGCYYLNKSSGMWLSEGVEVASDTDFENTHCISTHLTEFAGGFIVLPAAIDFDYVWANASFEKNMTIYLTIIIICSLYIILFIWTRYMDWKDNKKNKVNLLNDNNKQDDCFYELIFFTGSRKEAGTDSKVFFTIITLLKFAH